MKRKQAGKQRRSVWEGAGIKLAQKLLQIAYAYCCAHTLPPPSPTCLPFICLTLSWDCASSSPPPAWGSFVYFIFCKLSLLCHGQSAVCHAPGKGAQSWHNWTGQLEATRRRFSHLPPPLPSQGLKMINWQLLSGIMFLPVQEEEQEKGIIFIIFLITVTMLCAFFKLSLSFFLPFSVCVYFQLVCLFLLGSPAFLSIFWYVISGGVKSRLRRLWDSGQVCAIFLSRF